MHKGRIHTANALYEIAVTQQGYFTATQACSVGIPDTVHSYHVRTGKWIREWRGIYRLARFPETEDSYLVLWALWSRDRAGHVQGVYSHETALMLYDLSDVNPPRLHMTVPPGFRRRVEIPEPLVIHRVAVAEGDCEQRTGYSVVRPGRTIAMLIEENRVSDEIILQAIGDALRKGHFSRTQLMELEVKDKTARGLARLVEQIS